MIKSFINYNNNAETTSLTNIKSLTKFTYTMYYVLQNTNST